MNINKCKQYELIFDEEFNNPIEIYCDKEASYKCIICLKYTCNECFNRICLKCNNFILCKYCDKQVQDKIICSNCKDK